LEDVFNKIIEIDRKSREIVSSEKNKKQNIDEFIQNEFNTKKVVLDMEFKEHIIAEKQRYEEMFRQKKQEIDIQVEKMIEAVEENYKKNESEIIRNIMYSIKNEEE